MFQIKTILLPIEKSAVTNLMVAKAIFLAKKFNAKVMPLHAIDMHFDYPVFPFQQKNQIKERINRWLVGVRDELIRSGVTVGLSIVQDGIPHHIIKWASKEMNVDLVLIGARRKTGIEKLFGTTAEAVVRSISAPVWIVHPQESIKYNKIEKVLCPTDCSLPSEQTVGLALEVCRSLNAELDILHVFRSEEIHFRVDPNLNRFSESNNLAPVPKVKGDIAKVSFSDLKRLRAYLRKFDFSGTTVESFVAIGDPAKEIYKKAKENQYGLLVAGASNTTPFIGQFQSKTIDKILRKTPCSILTIKHRKSDRKSRKFTSEAAVL